MILKDKFIKEQFIIPALRIIGTDSKIKKVYFFPGLLSIIFLTALLVYQSIYTYIVIFGNKEAALEKILWLFHSQYLTGIIISWGIFILLYIFVMPIFEWGLIKYIEQKEKNLEEDVSFSDSLGVGLLHFFPLFEYNNLFSEFKLISILNAYLFVLRFVGADFFQFVNIVFFVLFIAAFFVNLMLNYSIYEIVLGKKKAIPALKGSFQISILNIRNTFKVYMFMFLLNARVIINFFIFLLFPILFALAVSYISSQFLLLITIIILAVLFILLVLLMWYIASVLEVLKTSIWYFAYQEGIKKRED